MAASFTCYEEVGKRVAQLYGDERLADVTFVVQQTEDGPESRFAAHRSLVSVWSQPLDRMLCGGFAECSSREVRIRGVDPLAFEAMLKLMYFGTVEISVENALAVLDVSHRFDVASLVNFSVEFLQNHTNSDHACRMLEVAVRYGLTRLVDKCIEVVVTNDRVLQSEDFWQLSETAMVELAKYRYWAMHEDEIYDLMKRWVLVQSQSSSTASEERPRVPDAILEHLRFPHMSAEKLKLLSTTGEVPHNYIFDALFFKLQQNSTVAEQNEDEGEQSPCPMLRYWQRPELLRFSWVPTSRITVSGDFGETAQRQTSNTFSSVRGDQRMQHGVYCWTVDIVETHNSFVFVGASHADDAVDGAWRSTGYMLYCLDSRIFHQGSGTEHPGGSRRIGSGDCIRLVLDCTERTLAFSINNDQPVVLFQELAPATFVPVVDLRDGGDKIRVRSPGSAHTAEQQQQRRPRPVQEPDSHEAPEVDQALLQLAASPAVTTNSAGPSAPTHDASAPPPLSTSEGGSSGADGLGAEASLGSSAWMNPTAPPPAPVAAPPADIFFPSSSAAAAAAAGTARRAALLGGGEPAGGFQVSGGHPHGTALAISTRSQQPRQSQELRQQQSAGVGWALVPDRNPLGPGSGTPLEPPNPEEERDTVSAGWDQAAAELPPPA